jgi:hypothetical protein
MKKCQVCSVPSLFHAVIVEGDVVQCTAVKTPLAGTVIDDKVRSKHPWCGIETPTLSAAAVEAFNNFDVNGAFLRFVELCFAYDYICLF